MLKAKSRVKIFKYLREVTANHTRKNEVTVDLQYQKHVSPNFYVYITHHKQYLDF